MSNCLQIDKELCSFLSKAKSEALLTYHEPSKASYIVIAKDGVKIVKLPGVELDTGVTIMIPEKIASNLVPGFYSISYDKDKIALACFNSEKMLGKDLQVAYTLPHSLTSLSIKDYLSVINNKNYISGIIPKDILILYSIVGNVSTTTSKAIEFGKGIAYMSAPDVKVVMTGLKNGYDYTITNTKMWFLQMFGAHNIQVTSIENKMALKTMGADGRTEYFFIFSKLRTSNPPNLALLDRMGPVYVTQLSVSSLGNVLAGLVKNKHNPARVVFSPNGSASLTQEKSTIIVPLNVTSISNVQFSIDADLLKRCISKIGSKCIFKVFPNNNFELSNKSISVIGGCEIVR